MKTKILYSVFSFFLLTSVSLFSQPTMHIVVFATTDDLYIGKGNRKSLELLDKELERIKREAKGAIVVSEEYFTGDRCTVEQFNACAKKLKPAVGLDDIVLFYFMGHGFMADSDEIDTPNLLFANTDGPMSDDFIQNNHLNLSEVHDKMKSTGARLTITVGEASNSHIEKVKDSRLVESLDKVSISPPEIIRPERYEELFNKPTGDIMIYSSMKGQHSYISDIYGGVFTQAFIKALHKVITSPNTAFWPNLCTSISKYSFDVCQEAGIIDKQMPDEIIQLNDEEWLGNMPPENLEEPEVVIVDIVNRFKGSKELKKAVRGMLKDTGSSKNVYDLLQRGDIMEENIKYQPLSHYMILGKMGGKYDKASKALLYYSVARSLYEPQGDKTMMSEIDYEVIEMMNKIARRRSNKSEFARAIVDAGSVYKWLVKSQKDLIDYMNEKKEDKEKEVKDLYDFIAKIDHQTIKERKTIDSIDFQIEFFQSQIDENQDTVKGFNAFSDVEVTASIYDLVSLTEQDKKEISTYIDCLQVSDSSSQCRASHPAMLLTGNATVNFASSSDENEASISVDPTGEYCTENIIRTTESIIKPISDALNRVPRKDKYMDQLRISGVIKGYADYQGTGKLLNIYYTPDEYLRQSYKNKYDEIKEVKLLTEKSTRITNEQLAFLRAYCAYQIIKDKIGETTEGMLNVDNKLVFDVKFEAIEQDLDDTSDPNKYRGVD